MKTLLMKLEAPMMSFGAPIVDNNGVIQDFPALSMLTGLIANALGYDHAEHEKLSRLQGRLRYAARRDRPGRNIRDYQTVDLGQDFMLDDRAWTTSHKLQERAGATSKSTHIRYRYYWADASYTLAVSLEDAEESPDLERVLEALRSPARPLFIGRKTCLPSEPIAMTIVESDSLLDALKHAPLCDGEDSGVRHAWWEISPDADPSTATKQSVTDRRDWKNQIHLGERWIAHGDIDVSRGD